MSHPIQQIYTNTIQEVVRAFIQGLPEHINRSGYGVDSIEKFLKDYKTIWLDYDSEILTAISHEISSYLNYYNVNPKGNVDELKTVYFTGMVVSRFLDRSGFPEMRKMNDFVTIALLDFRLKKGTGKSRTIMTKALRKVADQNEIREKLGQHGIYLMYRCVCNALTEESGVPTGN